MDILKDENNTIIMTTKEIKAVVDILKYGTRAKLEGDLLNALIKLDPYQKKIGGC